MMAVESRFEDWFLGERNDNLLPGLELFVVLGSWCVMFAAMLYLFEAEKMPPKE